MPPLLNSERPRSVQPIATSAQRQIELRPIAMPNSELYTRNSYVTDVVVITHRHIGGILNVNNDELKRGKS